MQQPTVGASPPNRVPAGARENFVSALADRIEAAFALTFALGMPLLLVGLALAATLDWAFGGAA